MWDRAHMASTPEDLLGIWCSITGGALSPASRQKFLVSSDLRRLCSADRDLVVRAGEDLYEATGKLLLAKWAQKVKPTPKYVESDRPRKKQRGRSGDPSITGRPRDSRVHQQISDRLGQREDYL
jgi:hypothetical protein